MEVYRLKEGILAVKLDSDGHGQLTTLSPGCVIRLGNNTPLRGFIEVICDGQSLSVFREDLEDKGAKVTEAAAPAEGEERL
jgi:hypothetical protein